MSKKGQSWYWWTLGGVACLVAVYINHRDLYGLYLKYLESDGQVQRLQEQLKQLEREEAVLEKNVENLGSDPLELEAAIRGGKHLVREGETVFRVELPESASE